MGRNKGESKKMGQKFSEMSLGELWRLSFNKGYTEKGFAEKRSEEHTSELQSPS